MEKTMSFLDKIWYNLREIIVGQDNSNNSGITGQC